MLRKMGEVVARVARKVNKMVESDSDTLDLAECMMVSFPISIYKVLRNVTDQIHLITLANNELKSLTSKFMTTFCQLQELCLEGNFLHRLPNEVSALQHLKAIHLSRNQFHDFPEPLTTLPALETISLEENEIVDVPVEKVAAMPALHSINLCFNPLNTEVLVIALPLITFDVLMSPEGPPTLDWQEPEPGVVGKLRRECEGCSRADNVYIGAPGPSGQETGEQIKVALSFLMIKKLLE
ncbi:leucine-rich repeat-containing protein 20-like [Eptesicus fuscus]|uniref:leucine-rich repeat-containing protein 20-like n=1 Tax=Eptesicus fuscus TaxID=29078 RepID=UPI0024044ECB|nr:leucine-rich repeat-containing protein 20-like [Eptesicus fuscus]